MGRLVKQPHGGAIYLADKGETMNPDGRPPKLRSELMTQGYRVYEIHDCITMMLRLTLDELTAVWNNPKATVLEKTIAHAIKKSLEKGSLYSIETLLSRAFGKPKETTEIHGETQVVHRIKLG